MPIHFEPHRHTNVQAIELTTPKSDTSEERRCETFASHRSGFKRAAKVAFVAASVLVRPAAALGFGGRPLRVDRTHSLPAQTELKSVDTVPVDRKTRALRSTFSRGLKSAPESFDVYLAPNSTFGANGFKVLDGKAGVGKQTVISTESNAPTQIFDVQQDGQVIASQSVADQTFCLDVFGAHYVNGASVDLWPCNGQANQQWDFVAAPNYHVHQNYFTLRPAGRPHGSEYCLDVFEKKVADGTPVQLYTCNGGANQQWTMITAG